ncbi:hypothetical protein E0M25_21310 [Bacillus mycoides]|uniref:hypothetical protein n=1 Tax=Bacillus mycoides TaxID=1405 RepID=UPI00103F0F60|nr:hypothetical protein [Bacillus mycoides]TBX73375.1 hypothetical protein E0M25_21310 [Bacillus mycoides]
MLTQKDQLRNLVERTELINDISIIALYLLEDEYYTKDMAAGELIKIINKDLDCDFTKIR